MVISRNTDGMLKTGWVKDGDSWRYYSGNKAAMGWLDISDKRYSSPRTA